ncbi:MAG: hypothetical protein QM762_12635 [Chryseolinea sp.]
MTEISPRNYTPSTGYPSEFVPQAKKVTREWCRQNVEAHHYEGVKPGERPQIRPNPTFARMRGYGKGRQSINQYKEALSFASDINKKKNINTSYRNVNFGILKVVPKIRGVLVNKMVNQRMEMRCRAIDPTGISQRRAYKSKLLEFIINKEAIEAFEQFTKLGLERPVPPGEEPPMNINEVDAYVDMNPRDMACMEVLDFIKQTFYENDWDQQSSEIAGDIVDTRIGGTVQYIDVDNKIKFRRLDPERVITNPCITPDFRDLKRFGEYVEMTVGDLKKETRGMWPEEEYQRIANLYTDDRYKTSTAASMTTDGYSYSYDPEKIIVLKEMWYSIDDETYVQYKNDAGNGRTKQYSNSWVPFKGDARVNDGKGLSDAEYNKAFEGKKEIIRRQVKNVYRCSWVVGTELCYEFGLLPNMLRSASNAADTIMPVTLVSTEQSTMEMIEEPADQVQLNWLQFQNHVSASKPPGIAIELHSLAGLSRNKGGVKFDPKEAIQQYAESGNLVYSGRDQHGNPLQQMPFQELTNGLSTGAADHFALILQFVDLIKNMVGLNALTEGQTPAERTGKTVAELSWGASDNALSHLMRALRQVYERTARNCFYLLQNNIQRMDPEQFADTLGAESYRYFMLNRDLALRDMGITMEEGPDDAVREKVSILLQKMVDNGEIPGEDAVMIEMVENPYRQVQMIKKHRLEIQKSKAADQERLVRAQGEENTKTAMATEQAKQQTTQMTTEAQMQLQTQKAADEERLLDKKAMYDLMLKRMEISADLTQSDKELQNSVLEKLIDGQVKIKVAQAKPKPKPAAKK